MPHNKPEIVGLTGLRAIAALSIVYGHYTVPLDYKLFGIVWQTTIIGMPLFFALSGFIIHYVYVQLFSQGWAPAVREFAFARFSRLYPLFIFLFAFFFLFSPLGSKLMEPEHWKILLSYLTLTSSWWYTTIDNKALIQFNYGWSWSVSTEWFFYVLYALLFYRIACIKSPRLCLKLLVGFCVLSYLLLYGVYSTQNSWQPYVLAHHHRYISTDQDFANSFYRWAVYVSPYLQVLTFMGGCLTCQFYLLFKDREDVRRRIRPQLLVGISLMWILLCVLTLSGAFPHEIQQYVPGFINFLHMNFLLVPACYMLILACALGNNSLSRVLSRPLPKFLGEISYSIYLAHLILPSFTPLAGEHVTLRLAMAMMLTIAIAAGLYTVVEVPAKRWLRKAS